MLFFSKWKISLILAVLIGGFFLALPNGLSDGVLGIEPRAPISDSAEDRQEYRDKVAEAAESRWPGFLPKNKVNLGLDLQGGVYLLMEIDPDEVVANQMEIVRRDVTDALLTRPRIASGRELTGGAGLTVTLRDPSQINEALKRIRKINQPITGTISGSQTLSITERGGGVIDVSMTAAAREQYAKDAQRKTIEIVRRRVDPDGVSEISVQPQGDDRIILEAPGEADPQRIKDRLSQAGRMTFNLVSNDQIALREAVDSDGARVKPGFKLLYDDIGAAFLVDNNPVVTGSDIATANQGNNPDDNSPAVDFRLNGAGAQRFGKVTSENFQRLFAIVLDDSVMSAPRINEPIWGGSVQITGSFTIEEAIDLSAIIEAGELPAKLQFLNERSVSASLGKDAIAAGTTASLIGLVLVAIFMVLAYSRLGLFAVGSLVANIVLILGAASALGITLTLPGIAGIILTIGMAVDANVLVFERIREETRAGRGAMSAVQSGYERALSTILDANITTFIAAAVLYLLGSGPVQGFAVTLAIGIVTSVFTAFVVTRWFTAMWLNSARPKKLAL